MAAGVTFKPKRKSGAFSGGELAAGEVGLDVTNGVWYYSSNGSTVTALGGGGGVWSLVGSITASSQASIDFTTGIDDANALYLIRCRRIVPETDVRTLHLRFSVDSGSTWQSGAADYQWAYGGRYTSGASGGGSASDTEIQITTFLAGNDVGEEGYSGLIWIENAAAEAKTTVKWAMTFFDQSGGFHSVDGGGNYNTVDVTDGLQLIMNTGSIASGTAELWKLTPPT